MKKRVLIVEDELVAYTVGKMLFEALDFEVTRAESGEQALELFSQNHVLQKPFQAIYMDLGLPKMGGIETCIEIRNYENNANLPAVLIIAVTANVDPNVTNECLSVGMMDVILKPLTQNNITRFLEKA